jgi:ferredoxin
MVPFKSDKMLIVACSNLDFGKDVRAVCKVGCIGCKACQRANDLFASEGSLPSIDYDKYDPEKMPDLNLIVTRCPMKRLVFVGRPSEKDQAALAGEKMPAVVMGEFRTTADEAEWRG